jgi:MYXO-CTERM domain-containing protein
MSCAEAQTHAVWLCESLQSGAGAAETFGGGSFKGAGFLVSTDPNSRLHWDLGQQVASGHLEVVIEGLSLDALTGLNQHLIELFDDGGHWSSDRAINIRAYGNNGGPGGGDDDEWGDLKLKIWDNPASLVAEERFYDFPWDAGPHLWSIDWSPESAQMAVDGNVYFDFDLTGFDTNMGHLWLPLNDWVADYSGVNGSLYYDLVLGADPEGEAPDVPGGDTSIAGNVLTTVAVDDTCVVEGDWADQVLGELPDLSVSGDGSGNPSEIGYLRFVVSGTQGAVTQARIRMHTPGTDKSAGGGGSAWVVSDTAWSEETTTWNNRPAHVGSPLSSVGTISPSSEYSFDVTGTVAGDGTYSFALVSTDGNGGHYATKEAGLDVAPMLEVTFDPTASGDDDDATPPPDDDDATTAADGDDDSAAAGDDDDATAPPPGDWGNAACSGCGSSMAVTPARLLPPAAFALVALGGFAPVRRRRP